MRRRITFVLILIIILLLCCSTAAYADRTDTIFPAISLDIGGDGSNNSDTLEILFLITVITLLPSIMIMMTSFTRVIIVLSFVRNALGLQQTPPNQVLIGLALFLTLFIMQPVINEINTQAYEPYTNGAISQKVALEKAVDPLREFMLKQTNNEDLRLFLNLSRDEEAGRLENISDIKTNVVIAAFITSEMKRAFTIGFMIFLPFLIIDMVVASVLMSMGMVMLPPSMISLPFKIMLFVLVDGWGLIVKSLILSFN
ncbi:MAG: flagellar type III secretion system pore protein FliP [Clostridia bacterium]|nr:flagellar type III secretion system pore protein FliP [Clostridia bacterium]